MRRSSKLGLRPLAEIAAAALSCFSQRGYRLTQMSDVGAEHVERSDRHASLAVAAWLLTGHHDVPGAEWIKVDAAKIDEAVFGGAQEPGREALPDQAALCETADR